MASGDVTTNIHRPISYACAKFDGVDDNIKVNSFLPLDFLLNKYYSFSFWIKYPNVVTDNTFSGQHCLLYIGADSPSTPQMTFTLRNNQYQWRHLGSVTDLTSECSQTAGEWQHIFLSVGVGSLAIYVNGVLQDDDGGSLNPEIMNSTQITLCERPSMTNYLGLVKDFRIYNKQLSQSEITRLYNNEDITDGLISNWKLNGNATDSVGDNDGTVSGATFVNDVPSIDTEFTDAYVSSNDKFFMTKVKGGGFITSHIEEA